MSAIEQQVFPGLNVELVGDVAGPAEGQAVLFLHGSGQTRQSWRDAVQRAGDRGYRAIALDLRGHGDSGWSPDGVYTLDAFAADIPPVVAHIGRAPILVGASLGGIAGMLEAGRDPKLLRALVLVDVGPKIELAGAKEVTGFMESAPNGFASLDEAADAVAAYLPHRSRPKTTSGLLRNLRLRDGRYHWHWDPALIQMGRNVDQKFVRENPLEAAARRVTIPTLQIRGGRSRVLSEEGVRAFRELIPHGEVVDIAGADHMVAGDANDAFNDAVLAFIDRVSPST